MKMKKGLSIPNKGAFYKNEFWFSPAYKKLHKSSRDLLQCLLTELRKREMKISKKIKWAVINNGEISFTAKQFQRQCGYSKQTYINARNQLIENGIIEQTYQGGNAKGDMATYRTLCSEDIKTTDQRWRQYPQQNWANDIPKQNGNRVGCKTQWKKGECGRKKSTLSHNTPNNSNDPITIDRKK